jgi:hypothetical protein
MVDVVLVLVLIVFFAVAAGFVTVCERIVGPETEPARTDTGRQGVAG